MKWDRMGVALVVAAGLAVLSACAGESETAPPASGPQAAIVKGGDDRAGEYDGVAGWWKPAPDHDDEWTWGQVSGVAVDTPDRIIVAVWGDRNRKGQRAGGRHELPRGRRSKRQHHRELVALGLDVQQAPPGLHQPLRSRAPRLGRRARRRSGGQHADPQVHQRRQ